MSARKKLVAGNWKMNGVTAALSEVRAMVDWAKTTPGVDLAVCPPATLAGAMVEILKDSPVALGGQDCHAAKSGAFTGDISGEMWADLGARYCIVGHSERRAVYGETDAIVAGKATGVLVAGLTPIICLGETLAQRDAGKTLDVIATQLAGSVPEQAGKAVFVIAYEPVWAIGTGRTPTLAQVAEVHVALRQGLAKRFGPDVADRTRLLYGGSVKPDNARELMHAEGVDGALVGGASLKAADFLKIAQACL